MKFTTFISAAVLTVLVLFGSSQTIFAQEQDREALLPDIDPQDIEIRGEFKARFPGLRRQPILGFNPNLQVYQIDPDRTPFLESGDQIVANLPVSELTRPAPPEYSGLEYSEEIYTFARLGVGSFTSPEAKLWAAYPINNNSYIGGDLDYSSSDGHLDEQSSSFRFLTAHGEYGTRINEKTELRVYAGAQEDFNYSAEFSESASGDEVRIDHEGYSGGLELSRFKNDVAGWSLQGNVRSFNTDFAIPQSSFGIDEFTYNGSFANRWALGNPNETLTLKAGGRGGNYEPGNRGSQQWGTLQGGVAYERLFNYQTHLHAEADVFYISNVMEDKVYPGGLFKIDHWFGERLKVTGKVEGKPHLNTVEQLHEHNRFLGYDNTLVHTYSVDVTGEASIKYYRGSKLHGGVTYTNAQDYAYFLPDEQIFSPVDSPIVDAYSIHYQNATNFKLFAGLTHQLLPERFWISGQAYLQNPELDNGEKIPFKESFGVNASMTVRPIERITIEGWADYVGERETGIEDNKIDGFFLVGSQLDVEITDNFGGYLKLVNMLAEEYEVWRGYQERPFQIYGGITLKF